MESKVTLLLECRLLTSVCKLVIEDQISGNGKTALKFFKEVLAGHLDVLLVFTHALGDYLNETTSVKQLGACFEVLEGLPTEAESLLLFDGDEDLSEDIAKRAKDAF